MRNGTGFGRGIRSLSLVSKTIVRPSVVYESYEIKFHILTKISDDMSIARKGIIAFICNRIN